MGPLELNGHAGQKHGGQREMPLGRKNKEINNFLFAQRPTSSFARQKGVFVPCDCLAAKGPFLPQNTRMVWCFSR